MTDIEGGSVDNEHNVPHNPGENAAHLEDQEMDVPLLSGSNKKLIEELERKEVEIDNLIDQNYGDVLENDIDDLIKVRG